MLLFCAIGKMTGVVKMMMRDGEDDDGGGEDDDDIQASLLCLIPWHPSGRKVERYVAAACTMMDRRRNTPPLLVPLCICISTVYFVFHVSIVILQGPQGGSLMCHFSLHSFTLVSIIYMLRKLAS